MMRVRAIAAAAALAGSVACSNTPTSPNIISSASNATVSTYIATFQTVTPPTLSGAIHGGTVSLGPGGPTVTASGSGNILSGGGTIVSLHATTPFLHAFVSVADTGAATAPSGFYEIDLPAPASDLQVVVTLAATVPTNTFSLQFTVTDAAGAGGSPSAIAVTVPTAGGVGALPAVLATYSPSPAAFLGGASCTLSSDQGCLWEFNVVVRELNGIGVFNATMNETFTFGSQTIQHSFVMSIPSRGTATVVRNLNCGSSGAGCATAAELAGGTYTYTITGTDINNTPFNFTGPVLTLSGQGK